MKRFLVMAIIICTVSIWVCGSKSDNDDRTEVIPRLEKSESIVFSCPAFNQNETIPERHTCDGRDLSPAILIEEIPGEAQSLAIICDDPDAPTKTWVHWVICNIPPDIEEIPEGVKNVIMPRFIEDSLAMRPIQGINDFGNFGYNGPCPPCGPAHHYFFKLYAIDTVLAFEQDKIEKGITKDDLLDAMKDRIIGDKTLIGLYKRR